MEHKPPPILVILVLLAIAVAGGYWYFSNNPAAWQQTLTDFGLEEGETETALTASGFIEANEIDLSTEIIGRIKTMSVDEGDPVEAGQVVIVLDSSLVEAQTAQIEAQIDLAEAQLAELQAGAPAEQISVARAALVLAEAERKAAFQAWQDAITLRDNPQELDAQIAGVRDEIALHALQGQQAALIRDAVELREEIADHWWQIIQQGRDYSVSKLVTFNGQTMRIHRSGHYEFPEGEKQQASVNWNLSTMAVWQAWVNLENATAARDLARQELNSLLAQRTDSFQADLQVSQANAAYDGKAAAVNVAQATLKKVQAGPPQSRIGVLQAQRDQAASQLATLSARLEKYSLVAPLSGTVVEQVAHQGEVATPGAPLLVIADLDKVTLTVYVPNSDYGRLQLGQTVEVSVDSYPEQTFTGEISYINDEAEFTPKNVQTKEERVSLVYAIKITLSNEDGLLKPGMPADAAFIDALPVGGGR